MFCYSGSKVFRFRWKNMNFRNDRNMFYNSGSKVFRSEWKKMNFRIDVEITCSLTSAPNCFGPDEKIWTLGLIQICSSTPAHKFFGPDEKIWTLRMIQTCSITSFSVRMKKKWTSGLMLTINMFFNFSSKVFRSRWKNMNLRIDPNMFFNSCS